MSAVSLLLCVLASGGCCKERPGVVVHKIRTGCLVDVGESPVLDMDDFDLSPEGCQDDMACLDMDQLAAIGTFISRSIRWIEQATLACKENSDD